MMELHCLIKKEGKLYSALCLEFDVASQGRNVEEAKKNIREAVEFYIEDMVKHGTKEPFFKHRAPYKYWKEFYQLHLT